MSSRGAMIERRPPDTKEGDKFGIMHPANSVTGTGGDATELRPHSTPQRAPKPCGCRVQGTARSSSAHKTESPTQTRVNA
jgi:hypothetical protein